MCGRYTQVMSWSEMIGLYRITDTTHRLNLPPRYNIAPTQEAPVVRAIGDGRRLDMLRWGLVPAWAKDIDIGARMINARAETVAEKPSFKAAFRRRRCLVTCDGFYEWQKTPAGKQPYRITLKGGEPFAFAGLWERWEKAADGKPIESFTIVTTEANAFLRPIHIRMPVILGSDDYDSWLDTEGTPPDRAAKLLRPFAGNLDATPVSTHVNSPQNDDPECIAALANAAPFK